MVNLSRLKLCHHFLYGLLCECGSVCPLPPHYPKVNTIIIRQHSHMCRNNAVNG